MTLEIDDSKTTTQLQRMFSHYYPLLKLEFCSSGHGWEQVCPEREIIHIDIPIGTIRDKHNKGVIQWDVCEKVGKIEREFYSRFGLNVQICYKSGRHWIQTGKSDNMSLGSLVRKASEESKRVLL